MCRDYAGTCEKVWRTPLNWAFVIRLHEHLNANSFCFYSLDFKAIFFLLRGSLWQRVPLENRQKMFLMKAEPRAVRGAIRVPSFVCHKKSRQAWQAFGPINNAWEELHPPWCQQKGTAEERVVLHYPESAFTSYPSSLSIQSTCFWSTGSWCMAYTLSEGMVSLSVPVRVMNISVTAAEVLGVCCFSLKSHQISCKT